MTYPHWQHGSCSRQVPAKVMIVTAESCTGGMVAAALTDIAGSSALERGLVTYSNAAKTRTAWCQGRDLTALGAVSAECALLRPLPGPWQRHRQRRSRWPSPESPDPGGGTSDKPIGLVHFARQRRNEAAQLDRVIFTGDRSAVREQATLHALQLLANAGIMAPRSGANTIFQSAVCHKGYRHAFQRPAPCGAPPQ